MTDNDKLSMRLSRVKCVLMVLSGKGGVGKSTVTAQLASSLLHLGHRVGVLDIDLCGPSIPHLFNMEGQKVHKSSDGWVPVYSDPSKMLSVMSLAFLLPDRDAAVVWRGPKKNATIRQLMEDVCWGELDFLLIDTPPGTSDEHISVCQYLKEYGRINGSILVTTPQMVSLSDVRREITFCKKLDIPMLGLVENMSGFHCPHCQECTNIFSTGGGQSLAEIANIPFAARIPIDAELVRRVSDKTLSFMQRFDPTSSCMQGLRDFVASSLVPIQQRQEAKSVT